MPGNTLSILTEIAEERARQDQKHGAIQDIPDGTGTFAHKVAARHAIDLTDRRMELGTHTWADILTEEVFEALAEKDEAALRKELIQSAAVCVKWVEHIDRRKVVSS